MTQAEQWLTYGLAGLALAVDLHVAAGRQYHNRMHGRIMAFVNAH